MTRARARTKPASRPGKRPQDEVAAVRAALRELPFEQQRMALIVAQALPDVANGTGRSESEIRSLLYRLIQGGLAQERRAPAARAELERTLGPSLTDADPIPAATFEQARRLAALRNNLLRGGAFTGAALAEAKGIRPDNARQWISRHRKANRIFTATYDGQTLLPAFLLDDSLQPKQGTSDVIGPLREAGEDGWALWAWFAGASPWLDGRIPADLLDTDPQFLARVARERATTAA